MASRSTISAAGSDRLPVAARLAVDADADLHLVLAELEARLARAGRDARSQRHAHAPALAVDRPADLCDLGERLALLGGRAADLLRDHGDADAAPAGGVERVLDRHVVVGDDGLDLDPLALREVGRHLEVEDVARVVLDDVEDAGAAVDRLGRLEHLIGRRRGEHLAGTGGVEHARADEAAVHRLVTRAAAGDDADLALNGRVRAHDHVGVVLDAKPIAVCRLDALQRLSNDGVRVVDQLLQGSSSTRCRPARVGNVYRALGACGNVAATAPEARTGAVAAATRLGRGRTRPPARATGHGARPSRLPEHTHLVHHLTPVARRSRGRIGSPKRTSTSWRREKKRPGMRRGQF